jgi:hypothetical protein
MDTAKGIRTRSRLDGNGGRIPTAPRLTVNGLRLTRGDVFLVGSEVLPQGGYSVDYTLRDFDGEIISEDSIQKCE